MKLIQESLAVGGEFGILEGRTLALVHPVFMGGIFVYTLWAGYLGWQWRRVRTIQDDINQLKKQKPIEAASAASPPPTPSPLDSEILQLTEVKY